MNTETSAKVNKIAAKEVEKIAKLHASVNLSIAMVRDLLYDYDHELLRAASKLHKRCYIDDLLNRAVYRKATLPYGGLQRRLLIDQFYTALGKCLACLSLLEDHFSWDESYQLMINDWNYLSEQIEKGNFYFGSFEHLFDLVNEDSHK